MLYASLSILLSTCVIQRMCFHLLSCNVCVAVHVRSCLFVLLYAWMVSVVCMLDVVVAAKVHVCEKSYVRSFLVCTCMPTYVPREDGLWNGCTGDFEDARGGVYFDCCNAFLPLMVGGDPYVCARAFIEDNALCMLTYILTCASCYFALERAMEVSLAASSTSTKKRKKQHYDLLLKALRRGKWKAFRVHIVVLDSIAWPVWDAPATVVRPPWFVGQRAESDTCIYHSGCG